MLFSNFNFPKIHLVHPPPPPCQILHNNRFQLLLGITVIQQWLGKKGGVRGGGG